MEILNYLGDEIYLFVLGAIMIISGIIKDNGIFTDIYGYLKSKFKSNRAVISILSFASGILPIEGRATVSAGILDTATSGHNCIGHEEDNNESRKKLGIVDFLTTHHFYMWSPLEKPVILPMAAFGIGYGAWLGLLWPLIAVSALFIGSYIWFGVKEEEVIIKEHPEFNFGSFFKHVVPFLAAIVGYIVLGGEGVTPVLTIFGALTAYYILITRTFSLKKLNSYINWTTIAIIGVVFFASGYMQEHREWIENTVRHIGLDMHSFKGVAIISLITFIASFSMGSDGKFAALTVLMSSIFGKEYLLWFFALDYAGYLTTPMHECVMIGKRYFGTSLKTYYAALILWALLLISVAGIFTFIK
jgi:hypothetical protein